MNTARSIFVICLLLQSYAVAQRYRLGTPVLSPDVITQTTAAMTLYVDPTGSDSNPCAAAGTSACLTIQGAVNKVPYLIRHAVIINVAAGSYSTAVNISTRTFTDAGSFTLQGSTTWTTSTIATGSATGTSTAYTAAVPSTVSLGTFTDSTQAWTVNDLKGRFLTITSGAASGQQRVIVGNTATALNLNSTITSLVSGTTYSIQEPSTIITGAVSLLGLSGYSTSSTPIIISDLTISVTSGNALGVFNTKMRWTSTGTPSSVIIRRLRLLASGGSPTLNFGNSWAATSGTFYAASTHATVGPAVVVIAGYLSDTGGGFYSVLGTESAALIYSSGSAAFGSSSGISVADNLSTGSGVQFGGAGALLDGTGASIFSLMSRVGAGSCIKVTGRATLTMPSPSTSGFNCTSTGTGLLLTNGGSATLSSAATATITSGTGDFSVDGTTYTSAFFNALVPKTIFGPSGSLLRKE